MTRGEPLCIIDSEGFVIVDNDNAINPLDFLILGF